jgi:HSP20 family protein
MTTGTITRWDPFRELEDFRHGLSSFFGRSLAPRKEKDGEEWTADWSPLVDIEEDDKEYLIKAELPAVKKEDVHVSVENGVLMIRGERKMEKEETKKKYHRVERVYGNFIRSFALPEDAESDRVHAEFKDGILKVHLPKSEKAQPKPIEVKVA